MIIGRLVQRHRANEEILRVKTAKRYQPQSRTIAVKTDLPGQKGRPAHPTILSGWNDEGSDGTIGGYVLEWDVDATVILCDRDSGVPNLVIDASTQCTISDSIAALQASAKNRGQFESGLERFLRGLRKSRVLTEKQVEAIRDAAEKCHLPCESNDEHHERRDR